MLRPRPVTLFAFIILGGSAPWGCGLADAFTSGGLEPVVLQYQGDTLVSAGTTIPFRVVVLVQGDTLEQPHLVASTSNPTILEVTAGQDSLRALGNNGQRDTLIVRLVSSILTDSMPTLRQVIRIRP